MNLLFSHKEQKKNGHEIAVSKHVHNQLEPENPDLVWLCRHSLIRIWWISEMLLDLSKSQHLHQSNQNFSRPVCELVLALLAALQGPSSMCQWTCIHGPKDLELPQPTPTSFNSEFPNKFKKFQCIKQKIRLNVYIYRTTNKKSKGKTDIRKSNKN